MSEDGGTITAKSTVILPLDVVKHPGQTTGMVDKSLNGLLRRVERRLNMLGVSAQAASEKAGLSKDAIRNLRRAAAGKNSRQGISTRTAAALAEALETSEGWLLNGEGNEELATNRIERTVSLVGYVGAGAETHFYAVAQGDLDEVPAPAGSSLETRAVEIRGDSLGSLFDRWLVFYDDVRSPVTSDLIGKLCVVGLSDERVLIKKIRNGSKRNLYRLLSEKEAPIEDVAVDWAAKVKIMVPR